MKFDRKKFFTEYKKASFGKLKQGQVDGLEALLGSIEKDTNITLIREAAYMLATVKIECAHTFKPITEYGSTARFKRLYGYRTRKGRELGNNRAGDGAKFRGRGYVQITGRANYKRMTQKLGLSGSNNLVNNPKSSLNPKIAYQIMSLGMRKGYFTGKKLSNYITASKTDYRNARRIINGTNKAKTIAGYAVKFEKILRRSALVTV